MENSAMPNMNNFNSYSSKENLSANSKNEKTTIYSENSDSAEMGNEPYMSKEMTHFPDKLPELINQRLNMYDTIMSEIRNLYHGNMNESYCGVNNVNLTSIAKSLSIYVNNTVSKKIRVMLIGNAGSGKSTFINWFIQEGIQRTGNGKESNEFTLITSGNYMSEFNGDITIKTYEYLKLVAARNKNFKDNLCTRMYVNKNIETKHIDFIDTPGLKDIMTKMDCDVNSVIYDLADFVDLVLVFFDSSSKALNNRIINVIRDIYVKHMEKILFVYSKIDEIEYEEDRIKLLCQTTQCLASKVNVRTHLDLIPIYIAGAKSGRYILPFNYKNQHLNIVNRLSDVVDEIKKLFFKKVQRDLFALNKDCEDITSKIVDILNTDNQRRAHKSSMKRQRIKHSLIQLFVIFLFLFLLMANISNQAKYNLFMKRVVENTRMRFMFRYVNGTARLLNTWDKLYIALNTILLVFFTLSGLMKKKFSKNIAVLHVTSQEMLRENLIFMKYVKEKYVYLNQAFYELKETM